MSRIDWCDEEDRPGQFALWDANCHRSLRGRAGQTALRDLEAALLAMAEKRLVKDALYHGNDVCAVGAYARHKGLNLADFDSEDETDAVGVQAGMPPLVAWKVVALNDITFGTVWDVGRGRYRDMTPEERYARVLAWVRQELRP